MSAKSIQVRPAPDELDTSDAASDPPPPPSPNPPPPSEQPPVRDDEFELGDLRSFEWHRDQD